MEYHCQIGEGIQINLNDLQMGRAELRRQFGSKLSRAARIKTNLDNYLALDEERVEEMKHYSTRFSSKHKADLQEKQINFKIIFKKKTTSGIVGPEEEVNFDGKVSEFCQRNKIITHFIRKWSRGRNRAK